MYLNIPIWSVLELNKLIRQIFFGKRPKFNLVKMTCKDGLIERHKTWLNHKLEIWGVDSNKRKT